MNKWQQAFVSLHMLKMRLGPWARLKRQARSPEATQQTLLRHILRTNAASVLVAMPPGRSVFVASRWRRFLPTGTSSRFSPA